jgi:hypothetical protein
MYLVTLQDLHSVLCMRRRFVGFTLSLIVVIEGSNKVILII